MKVGDIIANRETGTRAKIIGIDDIYDTLRVEVIERGPVTNYRPVGSVFPIYRRGDKWLKIWTEV